MHKHIIDQLKSQFNGNVQILTHPFFDKVKFLFSDINQVHFFDRVSCQRSIGEIHYNKLWPIAHINKLLNYLNSQKFDLIVDLSQTETSTRWMTYLDAKIKIGVQYSTNANNKVLCSPNQWINYLHANNRSQFHLIDVFKQSLSLSLAQLPASTYTLDKVHNQKLKRQKKILFQITSSDEKKNWPLKHWEIVIKKVADFFPDYECIILGDYEETNFFNKNFQSLPRNCTVYPCDLENAFNVLKISRLLVTLDTSIKHLGVWAQIPILELALGSSDFKETGAYQKGAWIISSRVDCYPCKHSLDCRKESYLCHDSLSPEDIFNCIRKKISDYNSVLSFSKNIFLNEVGQSPNGMWNTKIINQENNDGRRRQDYIEKCLEKN